MPDIGFSQFQKISQEQILSPQILHALKILQVPSLELGREIADELAKNPLLEEVSGNDSVREALPTNSEPEGDEQIGGADDVGSDALPMTPDGDGADSAESDVFSEKENWADVEGLPAGTSQNWTQADEERRNFLFDSLVEQESLPQLLESQIALVDDADVSEACLKAIAQNIDERGFLDISLEALAESVGEPLEHVEKALSVFQTFDPPGVGARDLREAFLIQLRRQGKTDSVAYRIVDEAYELFLARKFPQIARMLDVSQVSVRAAISEIAKLKRVPAEDFSSDENREVTPDMTFFFDREKKVWDVRMENAYIPKLRISNVYKELMAQGKIPAKDRAYFAEKMRNGRFLINAIEQRQKTIEQIGRCIIDAQPEFLSGGPAMLRPMKMSAVAAVVGVHETTISRAVSNKYAETPHGVFELRWFFNTGLATDDGEELANAGVRQVLKEIVDAESPKKPLSDQRLVAELAERGIKIARRTITKYRAMLNIPPAHLRKKF